jgi:chromosome partitioning protein
VSNDDLLALGGATKEPMQNTIAVMNTKGGVGKSTLVLALAETLSAFHNKNVLVIDSDSQCSVSSMLMTVSNLYKLQSDNVTLVDYLVATVLHGGTAEWPNFVVRNVSDVDESRTVYILPSNMQLTLFEREVSRESLHRRLRDRISELLEQVRKVFDIVLIDCPPGLSVLTESWLREADFHISPTKADYISVCGLEVFRRFKALNPEMGFARNLGVIVNMKDRSSPADEDYHKWLLENPENLCFTEAIPRLNALQDAARFQAYERSYAAKYPGQVGQSIKALTVELLRRLEEAQSTDEPKAAGVA